MLSLMEVFMLCTKIYISDTKKPMTIESTSGISESQHNAILDKIGKDYIYLEYTVGDISLSVEFNKEKAAFIGWVDEYNDDISYFDNGSQNIYSVDLIINACPQERMMCYSLKDIKVIIVHFCKTGEKHPSFKWTSDTDI